MLDLTYTKRTYNLCETNAVHCWLNIGSTIKCSLLQTWNQADECDFRFLCDANGFSVVFLFALTSFVIDAI